MKKISFFIFLIFIFFAQIALSAPPPPSSGCESSDYWKEYRAESEGCGDVSIWQRNCRWICEECQTEDDTKKCLSWKKECTEAEKVAICNPWQKPKGGNVTEWDEREINCKADPDCFASLKVEKFLDGRGEVNSSEIHLPVKFLFHIKTPDKTGWGLSCGSKELKIEINNLSRILDQSETFSLSHYECATSDREILDHLWENGSLEDLANFLIQFTNDDSLKSDKGEEKIRGNKVIIKEEEKIYKIEYFDKNVITNYSKYEKLKLAKEYMKNGEFEPRKQIEYFIHFTEDKDSQRYFECKIHPKTGETIEKAYCGYFGGRNPKIENSETLLILENTYSPSQDRKFGPCKIKEGTKNFIKIKLCGENGCGPENPGVSFTTVDAPEPIGILAFSKENITWTKDEEKKKSLEFKARITRWIDTDWNGDDFPKIPKEIGADFVDFQFCGQKVEIGKMSFLFRSLYRGKKLIYDQKECPKEMELKETKESLPERCVDANEECICDEHPEWCEKYCGAMGWIENLDICHPWQNPESLRIEKGMIKDPDEFIRKNHLDEEPLDCTSSYPFITLFGVFLAENEEISIDWKDDPYYGVLDLPYPEALWKWDFQLQYFPPSPIQNVWQIQKAGSKYWSQKWHFKLTSSIPLKQKEIQGESKNIRKIVFEPIKKEEFESKIEFSPTYMPISNPVYGQEKGFNRLQRLDHEIIPRVLSYKIEICIPGGKCLKLPVIYTQLRRKPGAEKEFKKFNFWEIWPCLKYPGAEKGKINAYRLNKSFEIRVSPCRDEWGENCIFTAIVKAKTTGAPPKGLSPPPPSFTVIPTYLRVEPVPGAVSYVWELVDEGKKEFCANKINFCQENATCTDPQTKEVIKCTKEKNYCPTKEYCWLDAKESKEYKWRIRSCADNCPEIENENLLQCGEFSEVATFYGCSLLVSRISPEIAESFLPGDVTLSWEKINCGDAPVYYQLMVVYSKFPDEKREECKNLDKKEIVNTTLSDTNFTLSNLKCYGTYYWYLRGCLDKNCTLAGDWRNWYFNIVQEKPPAGGGKFEGLGTCKKIAPDCPAEGCTIKEIPKLIFNILNCLLWTGVPILLIIGVISTGLTLIFFATSIELWERVKRMWKGIGIGILIMFFGWTILNIIFLILGWRKEIFGDWFNPF